MNGKYIGRTPLTEKIEFGNRLAHLIVFDKKGYKRVVKTIDINSLKGKNKITAILKKKGFEEIPYVSIKYEPLKKQFKYEIKLEKAYEETVENSPNAAVVEQIVRENPPVMIGKIDAAGDYIAYTRIYPKDLDIKGLNVKNLRDIGLVLRDLNVFLNLVQQLKGYSGFNAFKDKIYELVYLKQADEETYNSLINIISSIESEEDFVKYFSDIETIYTKFSAILRKLMIVDIRNFSSEIWLTKSKGSVKVRATNSAGRWIDESPSLDYKYIYFSSNRGSSKDFDIWRIRINGGGGLTKISNSPYSQDLSPAADISSDLLAFISIPIDATNKQIWTIKKTGYLPSQLRQGEEVDISNGVIVFTRRSEKGTYQIWVMNADGTNETVLTEDTHNSTNPSLSPDGRWIAYVSDQAGNKDIWIMKTDGSQKTQLTTNPSTDIYPTWDEEGFIYFVSNRGLVWSIWRIKPNLFIGTEPSTPSDSNPLE